MTPEQRKKIEDAFDEHADGANEMSLWTSGAEFGHGLASERISKLRAALEALCEDWDNHYQPKGPHWHVPAIKARAGLHAQAREALEADKVYSSGATVNHEGGDHARESLAIWVCDEPL